MTVPARFVVLLALTGSCFLSRAADSPCAAKAIESARKLLTFHAGADDRIEIDKTAKKLPSIRNPESPNQRFEVLEVWGYIYKGKYRMRLIFYNSPATSCLLMGQEVLEYARL